MNAVKFLKNIWNKNDWRIGVGVKDREQIRIVPFHELRNADEVIVNPINLPRLYAVTSAVLSYANYKYEFLRRARALRDESFFNKLASEPFGQILLHRERFAVIEPIAASITTRDSSRSKLYSLVDRLEGFSWERKLFVAKDGYTQAILVIGSEKRIEIENTIEAERESLEEKFSTVDDLPRKYREHVVELLLSDFVARIAARIDRRLRDEAAAALGADYAGVSPLTDLVFIPVEYGGSAEALE